MSNSALRLAAATVGTGALALVIPASAQQRYSHDGQAHHRHARSAHNIVVHPQYRPAYQTTTVSQGYGWGPVGAVGHVVGGVGDATRGVFYGTGAVVGGVVGGVFGGVNALFSFPTYNPVYNTAPSYAYGYGTGYAPGYGFSYRSPVAASIAAPFNAAGNVVAAPFHAVGGALGGPTYVSASATYASATGTPVYSYESQVGPQPGWVGHCDLIAGNRVCF
jgi:hypothetical protein